MGSAPNTTAPSQPLVNGDASPSQTLNHITSYPLVSESLDAYQKNPYGEKSLELFRELYARVGEPLRPYLATPYSIASPYLSAADSLGERGLGQFDYYFPSAKRTDFATLREDAYYAANYPRKLTSETYTYVWDTYHDEASKVGDQGVLTLPKAVLSTELRIIADTMRAVANIIGPAANEAKAEATRYAQAGQEKLQQAKQRTQTKVNEVTAH